MSSTYDRPDSDTVVVEVFRMILIVMFLLFSPSCVFAQSGFATDHSSWDQVLRDYVTNGRVRYGELKQRRAKLDSYLEQLKEVTVEDLAELEREERMAFWINLYNASVVRIVLDQYPVKDVEAIPAMFRTRTVETLNDAFSPAELRDEILRLGFRDERLVTALVSGRMDSPRLAPEAFSGGRLNEQLDQAAQVFVDDDTFNRIEPGKKKIFLSPLFKEFGDDFILNYGTAKPPDGFSEPEAAVIGFILDHSKDPPKRLFLNAGRYKISYFPPNSGLNEYQEPEK